jgi:small subunit ribosomal protein S1
MPYGCFVKLEDGIEGLVHISEMSWTKRINHPSEMVNAGDEVEVMVLEINVEKQEISLGIKQTDVNPWELVEQRYPTGTIIEGTVRNITSYGAFVEIEEGIDGLLHVSDMSWTKKINHPSEILKKGERVKAVVLTVDPGKKRVALGIKQLQPDPWSNEIPGKYSVGEIVSGTVTKITNFGVFVELEEGLEGLLHISEISARKVNSPEEVVKVGKRVEVRILKVDSEERKIGLSMIDVEQSGPEDETEVEKPEERAEERPTTEEDEKKKEDGDLKSEQEVISEKMGAEETSAEEGKTKEEKVSSSALPEEGEGTSLAADTEEHKVELVGMDYHPEVLPQEEAVQDVAVDEEAKDSGPSDKDAVLEASQQDEKAHEAVLEEKEEESQGNGEEEDQEKPEAST